MRHHVKGRKLNRTSSHKKALMRTLVTQLLEYKRIHTTEAKAKELRPYAEKIITKARLAYQREQQGLLADGQKHDVHTRRLLGRDIRKKSVIESLFDDILPTIGDRAGGYTRIVKTGIRRGDSGRSALIELVDYNTEVVGTPKKKASKPKAAKTTKTETKPVAEVAEEVVENVVDTAVDTAEAVADKVEETVDTAVEATEEVASEVAEAAEETVEAAAEVVEETAEIIEESKDEVVEAVKEVTEEATPEESSEEVKDEASEESSDDNKDEEKKD